MLAVRVGSRRNEFLNDETEIRARGGIPRLCTEKSELIYMFIYG